MSWKDEAISVSETNLPEQDKPSWKDSAVDLDENGQVIPKHSAFVRGFMNSVGVQTPMMIGSSIEGIGRTLPISQNLVDAAAKPFYDMAKSNEYLEPVQIGSYEDIVPENAGISDAPEIISRGLTYAGESIGQGVGSIVPTAVGTGAGAVIGAGIGAARGGISGAISGAAKGADIGGVGGSFSLNYGEIYESLKQEAEQYEKETGIKSSEKDLAEMALIPGLGAAALDFASLKRLMPNMKDITSLSKLTPKEAAKEMFSKYKEGFATEGITEGAQTALGTANNITAFDREVTSEDLTDIVNSSIVGALSGGVIESGANALPIAAKTLRRDVPQDIQPTKDDLLAEMERGTQQEQVVEPQQPEIQAPEVIQEPQRPQQQTEVNQQQTIAPTQDNALAEQSANIGDVIEHITDEEEIIYGTVINKKVSENGNTTLIVTDDLGNKSVVFEGTGQTNVLRKKQPNKDDLLSMMEADNNQQKEQEPVDTLENLNKRLENVRKIAKLNGWNKFNKQKENEILSKIEGLKKQEIDTAALDVAEEPTQAQQEAGNYKKGHVKVSGLDITIENQKDSVRSGIDSDGEKWNVVMPTHYGYIKRTEGADGDHVDAYIGDNPSSETVYIIDQIDANTGAFDEHKTFIGFNNPDEVKNTYYKAFSDGMALKRYGGMTEMSLEQFKDWLKNGDTKKPLTYTQAKGDTQKPQETANIDKGVTPETENTDTLSTLTKQNENVPQIITGEVGMRLAEKAVVLTSTGRQTTPFPSVGIGSPRRVNLTVERIKKWLMQNALDEARSRGDEFNARQFEANLNRASQADLDSAENYLFNPDFIFENPPKILKDMGENMGISKTETTIEEPTISKEETVKSDPTEIDTSNWIVERLPQGEGQKRKGIIKAGVWDVSIGKLQIRKTREYPENISDADIISKVAELELRDKLNKSKYEPPTAEELEEEKRLEEIAQAEYEKEEAERIEQEKAEKRQREEEDEKLQSIGDKITTFLDSKGDAVRYRDHGSKLSRSAYFEIDINPIYEDGEIVDYNDSVKVRISDHTLPPTYGRDNGYADFEFGIRNQADPEFYGEDPQPLFDYINKKIEQSKLDKETQESLNTEETAVSDDVTDKNVGESEEPVKKEERATKKQDRGRKMQDVGEKLEGKRALQDKLGKSSYPEKAKEIIEATRPKNAFKFQQRDGQTSGVARFAQKLQENLYDYSEYLKSRGTISRSRSRHFKMYGWEQQLANIFADGADIDGADIGPRNSISGSLVIDYRRNIIEAAEEYVELAERLNYMFENSYNIEQFKAELSNAFEDGDFKALFDKYAKTYGLKRDIFTDSYYSPFARITDETDIKKQNRVEKTLSRPKLEKVERVNLKDHRKGRDVSETEFMNTFGFRGVEFGEWVSSKEGQAHVNLSYDALMDLADRLKINPKHISLGGKLGFAFGSRGKGEHSAHFEPTNNVINLTKTRGDGAVAHEWFHALDYNLRQSGADGVKFMDMAYKTMTHKPINDIDNYLKNRLIDNLNGTSYWQRGSRNKLKLGVMGEAKYTIEQYALRPFEFMFRGTDFKREGDSLGKDYWGTPIELIARSWESYIHDTLDGTNQYLVNDWVADGFVSKENGYRGTIYPVGEERKSFNDFFSSFMQNIEFNDTGVKVKEGAILPIQADVARMIEKIQSFESKLGDMLKEIRDGSIQQTEVQTSIPDSNVGESAEDVSGTLKDEDIERLFGRKSSGSSGDVQENTGSSERAGDENGGGSSSIGDRIQRDDTVPERVEDSAPTFSAKGHNHKISIGSLDEKRSPKKKAQDNIEIIKTVKSIEKDNRAATPEEQEMLAKYTGWGSLKNAFPKGDGVTIENGWEGINSSLKSLLSEKEYNEARSSIQYAHYTSEIVVRSMWKAMQKLGLSNGNIFEPGMGIGNFLGMIPDGMDVQYSGLELDPMSARIASILYPESSVRNADFTSARYGDSTFSAAIGNPPFSNRIVSSDPKYKSKKLSIHNYFFAKTLDMVAPGGVLAFVTSRYSLDAIDSSARKMMSESADLIGAIRLPNTAFKTNANTEVVTDIIFLRKRLSGEESNGTKWLDTIDMDIVSDDGSVSQVPINEYYHNNPEMILGDISLTGSMYSKNEFTVNESASHNLQEQLDEAISRLPDNVVTDIQKSEYAGIDMTPSEEKEGAYYIKDGTLMQVQDGVGSPVPMRGAGTGGLTKDSISKIKALIPVRDALRKSMEAMVKRDDKSMRSYQKELKKAYDSFVKKYGPITKSETDSRAATVGQIESARNDVRNDFIAAGEEFNEGDIDLSHLIGKVNPETGKKYTDSQIGAIRQSKRDQIISNGGVVDEGDFNPDDVPPNVVVKYPNLDPFMDDPEAYNLMMLEDYNEEEGKAKTTSVFEKNIVSEVKLPELKTPVDALNRSLVNRNGVDIEYMSQELGQDREKIATELEDLGLIYRLPNPEGGNIYVYSEEYLSGYVKDKLRYAKQLAKYDPYYKKNVLALEAVQPRDIPASDINTQIGAPYFDENLMIDFMQESLGISANITRIKSINKWDVTSNDRFSPENTTQWGTSKRPATEIVESLLMRKNIQVTSKDPDGKQVVDVAETQAAQDKARLIQEKFNDWIWKSGHSDRIFREYNDEYNNIVPRVYNGEHITTSISPDISLKDHQKNVVWRVLQSGNTYIAHAVGAGKTISSSSIAMEMRRIGSWRKPMIVVPNHMLAQFAGEFKLAYPQSNIIIADENKFHKDKRNRFVASVAKGDFDAVIMTFSSFAKTPVSKDFEIKMLDEQLAKYRMALQEANKTSGKRSSTAANVEKQIKKMEERISRLKRIDVDQSFYFEQLGVDAIIVDEAHNYRKLSFATNQGNMKGVSPIGSKSSWDLYAKTRYLDTIHPSRNLVMMSGTPLTNTLAEVFTMQRFMNERALISKGIDTFDAWSSSFASAVSAPERQPSGAYKTVTRLSDFKNLGPLSQMTRQFMDVVTSEQLGALVDRPTLKTGSMIIKTTKPTDAYLAFQKYLDHRTKAIQSKRSNEKGSDNILNIIGEGRMAAIDMRMIDPTLPEQKSKLTDMVDNVYKIWKETSKDSFKVKYSGDDRVAPIKGGVQLIFSDLGVHAKVKNGVSFSPYSYMKRKLISLGVPAKEIAFISDYETVADKNRLQNMMRNGEIRILIGSTRKMGTGLNVQNRLKAIHNLDAPWIPADLEQRNGRGLRQGNQYKEIEIYGYGTEGTYDSTMWQLLERKAGFISKFLKGDSDMSSMSDIEETDMYRLAKAMTSGDPRVLKQAELQGEVETLSRQSRNFTDEQVKIKSSIASKISGISRAEDHIKNIDEAKSIVKFDPENFLMTVMGKPYSDRSEAAGALDAAVSSVKSQNISTDSSGVNIGSIGGFNVKMFSSVSNTISQYEIFIDHPAFVDRAKSWSSEDDTFSASGTITRLMNNLNGLDKAKENSKRIIEMNKREIGVLESQKSESFPKQKELESKRSELIEINNDLQNNAPVEISYDEYPIEYWEDNKMSMSPRFSIVGDDEYSLFAGAVKEKSRNKVIKAISRQAKKLGIDLNEIEIFGDISEVFNIPTVESSSIGGEIQGFYYNNLIYISMKAGDYISTLNHEVIHKLKAAGAFTKQEWSFLEAHAKEWRSKYKIEENYENIENMTERKMDEEAIAHAFQDYSNKGFMDRLRGRVRVFFKMLHSVLTGDKFRFETVEDVFEAVLGGYVSKRKFSTDTSAMTMFQSAFHGSPYQFDKFTTDHIGTGEGAQAFGWGLYFAGKKQIAEYYRKTLSSHREAVTHDGKTFLNADGTVFQINEDWHTEAEAVLRYAIENNFSVEDSIKSIRDKRKSKGFFARKFGVEAQVESILTYLEKAKPTIGKEPGQLYEVSIPEDDVLLHWDKPLSEQPQKVKDALLPILQGEKMLSTGEQIYNKIAQKYAKSSGNGWDSYSHDTDDTVWSGHKGASLELNELGIKGIKYEDNSSRGKDRDDKTFNYVIFDDSAIEILDTMYSIVPDVKNDAAMFSLFGNVVGKKLTKKDQLDQAISSLHDVRGLDKDMRPKIKVISTYLLHPRQIASLFEKFTPVFMAVTNMMQRRDKIVHELTESITQYNHLPRLSKDKVNAVLELGRLSKMSKKTIIKNDDGSITAINSGINAALSKDGDRITLTKEEMDAYVGVRNTMNLALDLYIEVILEEYGYIEKGIKTSKQLEEALESETDLKEIGRMQDALFMIKEIEKSKRAGYVPFTRWGQIGVTVYSKTETVENENGEQVPKLLHFERIELGVFKGKKVGQNSEVIEAINRLKEKYGDDADISSFEMKDMTSVKGRIRMRDLDLLAASSDMSRDDYETLREMLQDEVKRRGFRAHFFKAEDIPGYDPDIERALNDYVVSISGHLARRIHQSKIEDTLKSLAESGQDRLYKYASDYVDYVTDPIEEYGALRQMGFMWYLAGNVASGLTNATQPIMVTAPWFKAMFSHGNILKNMSKAYKDASMMLTVKSGTDMFDFSKAPDDIKSILKEADEYGLFLPKQTFDAMSIAYTNSQHLRGLNRKARTMMDVMSLTFSVPERMNRLVTYISAYRMAIDPDNKKKIMAFIANDQLGRASLVGKEGKEFAMAFAEYAVYSTQLQMGRLNRPTISRGLGTLPLQFMSFPMQMMELMYRLTFVHGGQKGQAIAFMIMAVVFMSGLKGIPFEDDLQDLIEGAYKRLTRTDIDIDTEVRGLLSKAVGPNMAEAIMKGVPAAFLNVDMSSRLGFGNLVPTDGNDMLGVWWDMLYTRPTTAMTSLARGDTAQAISDLSPAIIKNPLQAYIWSQDGVRSSSTGDTVIIPDDLTKTDIGLKALGFTSGDVSRERERIYARRRADNAVNDLRSDYYDRLARAYAGRIIASRNGDSERQQLFESQIQAINEQKTAYNADKPLHRQIIIHDPSLKKRILEELQGAKANKPRKQSRAEAQKIDEIYGN